MAEREPIIITARYSSGTYIARHARKAGSSTAGHEQAVRLVATKVWGEGAVAELMPCTFVEPDRYPYLVVLTEKAKKASLYVIEVYGCASPTWVSESSDESPEELSITTDPQLAARFDRLAEAHGTCSKLAKCRGDWLPFDQREAGQFRDSVSFKDNGEAWLVGKKIAGRLLDGREWNELPEALR